ncbi:MAG: hypothetical protein HKN21_11605 [Candidatus Eisenbacteria bacterium]|uniref:Carboxymuconolactone decarboxylase-like domain-containing protein n=1 Tax=Eiseniibacteriota bacterium TaxID=2212470 RepID=A0A7Y2E8X3_UNCEI|nr:hypothetical protein [Candidatus Eisenbacteria bacterium]
MNDRQLPTDLASKLADMSHFGEGDPTLDLALSAAACAKGDIDLLAQLIDFSMARSVSPELLREALLQTYLFAGYPRAINGLGVLAERAPLRHPHLDLNYDPMETARWMERGRRLCHRIYQDTYPGLLQKMEQISPELGRWMILEGYGKVLSRPNLDAQVREMVACAALMVLRVPKQLKSHLLGSLHVGATREQLGELIDAVGVLDPQSGDAARELLQNISDA